MPSAVVSVTAVQKVEGVSKKNGKPYTKYVVHSDNGDYSTFDATAAQRAYELVGKLATVSYKAGQWGNDLDFIDPAPADAVASEAIQARTDTGDADWDLIGLRKTRCLLWAHFLGSDMAIEILKQRRDEEAGAKTDAIYRVGSRLVALAERDIYHRAPAGSEEDIPFMWQDGYGREAGVHFDPWRP